MARNLLLGTALQTCLTCMAAAVALPANAQPAPNARPTGGNVVAGAASISQTPNQTVIDQSSQRGAINWQSYNVGGAQRVVYNQPSSNSVTLNRVVGPDPSQIAGRIDANGQIILINQSGVNFYKGAQVNTAGLIVTTANATDSKFMAGGPISFDQPGNPNARIDNQGNITVKQAGLAALVAPRVANSGTITAQLGHVVLAGAKTATLDLYGDGLLSLDVSNQVTHAPVGRDGKAATALVTNTGVIVADGGTVQLTARAADGIVQTLVQAGGTLRAATMGDQTGVVALNGVGGSIVVQGQLATSGATPGTRGGAIEVVSDGNVTVASKAKLDASGNAGGGVVAIGTTLDRARGGSNAVPAQIAKNVVVRHGATVAADAITNGNGGHVAVLSTGTTAMAGLLTAKGGTLAGNGGLVEISSEQDLSLTGGVDVSARIGQSGTTLLDPTVLNIIQGTGSIDPNTVSNGEINLLGSSGPVVLQTSTGTIGVHASIITANALSLEAGGDLLIDRGVTISSGGMLLLASGTNQPPAPGLLLASATNQTSATGLPLSSANIQTLGTGSILLGTTGTAGASPVVLSAQSVIMQAGSASPGHHGVDLSDSIINHGTAGATSLIDLSAATGGINQASNGVINAVTLQSSQGVAGNTSLMSVTNSIGTIGNYNQTGGFSLSSSAPLIVAGTITDTSQIYTDTSQIYLESSAAGGIRIALGGSISSGSLASFQTDAFTNAGSIGSSFFELAPNTPGGTLTLGTIAPNLALASLVGISVNNVTLGSVTLPGALTSTTTAGAISIAGPFGSVTANIELAATGPITEGPAGSIAADSFTASTTGTGGSILLGSSANMITASTGITATNGNVVLVDGQSLTLTGTHSGNNLFFEVATGGGTLILSDSDTRSDGANPATLTTSGAGRITLIADNYAVESQFSRTVDSTITAGTVELAPFSGGTVSLLGSGGLVVGPDLLSIIQTNGGTLEVGGFTDVRAGANTPAAQASAISIDGAVDLTNIAGTLRLDTTGAITEFTNNGSFTVNGTLTVTNLIGSAATATIDTPGNLISNLGNFTTSGNLTVVSATSLTIDGAVNAGGATAPNPTNTATATLTTSGGLQIGGSIPGSLNAGTVTLSASGGSITEPNGTIRANSFGANASSSDGPADVLLASTSNAIAVSTGITATNGKVELVDDPTLLLTGTHSGTSLFFEVIQPGGSLQLGDAATPAALTSTSRGGVISLVADTMTVGNAKSSITAPAGTLELAPFSSRNVSVAGTSGSGQLLIDATLLSIVGGGDNALDTLLIGGFTNVPANATAPVASASGIALDGPIALTNQATTLRLLANGTVTEPGGPLAVFNIIGTSVGTFSLANKSNAVSESLGITATNGDVVLVTDQGITLAGQFSGNNLFFEVANTGGTLALGLLRFPADRAGYVPAALTAGAGGRISLVADNDTVTQPPFSALAPSSITVPNGSLELATYGPSMADMTTSKLISSGLLPIINTAATRLNTLVIGGFTDIPNSGTISTPSAASVTIDGALDLTNLAQALDLEATGSISQSSPITNVGTLLGTGSTATLTNPGNTIGTLAAFSTKAGFALLDNRALLVAGPVVDTGTASKLALTTLTGDITLAGVVRAANIVDLTSAGAIRQTGGALVGATLQGTAATSASLIQPSNMVGTLGPFSTTAGLALVDNEALLVTGPVTDTGLGSKLALTTRAGGITLAGAVNAAGIVDLTSAGSISEPGGALIAGTLQSTGGVVGNVDLVGNANTVVALGNFTVTGTGSLFALDDNAALAVTGTVGAPSQVYIETSNSNGIAIEPGGGVAAGTLASFQTDAFVNNGVVVGAQFEWAPNSALATQTLLSLGNIPNNARIGAVSLPGKATPTITAGSIVIGGAFGTPTTNLELDSLGGIGESAPGTGGGGTVKAANLTGQAGASVSLTTPNTIAGLGRFAVGGSGSFTLNDTGEAGNLSIIGPVSAANVSISDAGAVTVSGAVIASAGTLHLATIGSGGLLLNAGAVLTATTVDLDAAGGGVSESSGLIDATTLLSTGGVAGSVKLNGLNNVATLGNFSADSFALTDRSDLLIAGTLNAAQIAIRAPANQISLGDGASIITGGMVRPTGSLQASLDPANGGPGALLQAAGFAQTGSSSVIGQAGGPATLQISTTGNAQFDPSLGLQGSNTWLILNLTNGTAAGNVIVNALDVTYTTPGSTNLSGAIAGVSGGPAAALGNIQPQINNNYLFNGCVIASPVCHPTTITVILTAPPGATVNPAAGLTATLGAIYPLLAGPPAEVTSPPKLVLVTLPMLQPQPPQLTDPDVVPPNITYLDY